LGLSHQNEIWRVLFDRADAVDAARSLAQELDKKRARGVADWDLGGDLLKASSANRKHWTGFLSFNITTKKNPDLSAHL
jgi:hypothetical protein